MSRGLSNNNPGNIRISSVSYMGEVVPSKDRSFKQFSSLDWGYRAMFVVLHSYRVRYGLNTLRGVINRYAPPCENHTDKYVDAVCKWSGVGPDEPIDTLCGEQMLPIVAAMSRMENGTPALDEQVNSGWQLFIKHKP